MFVYEVLHYSSPAYCLSSTQSQSEATNKSFGQILDKKFPEYPVQRCPLLDCSKVQPLKKMYLKPLRLLRSVIEQH